MIAVYDNIATLYKDGTRTYDTYGNETITQSTRTVYVQPRGVYNAEFYNAAQAGLHPSITLTIANREDYEGEVVVQFEGKMYDVIRTDWNAQRDPITLILQERIHGFPAVTYTTT